jgi:hypothetical protein
LIVGLKRYNSLSHLRGHSADGKIDLTEGKQKDKIKALQLIYADSSAPDHVHRSNLSYAETPSYKKKHDQSSHSPDFKISHKIGSSSTKNSIRSNDKSSFDVDQRFRAKHLHTGENFIGISKFNSSNFRESAKRKSEESKFHHFAHKTNSQFNNSVVSTLNQSQVSTSWKQNFIDSSQRQTDSMGNVDSKLNKILDNKEYSPNDYSLVRILFENLIEVHFSSNTKNNPQFGQQLSKIRAVYDHLFGIIAGHLQHKDEIIKQQQIELESNKLMREKLIKKNLEDFSELNHFSDIDLARKLKIRSYSKPNTPKETENIEISLRECNSKLQNRNFELENQVAELKNQRNEYSKILDILKAQGIDVSKILEDNAAQDIDDDSSTSLKNLSTPVNRIEDHLNPASSEGINNLNSRGRKIPLFDAKSFKSNSEAKSTADSIGKNKFRLELENFQQKSCDSGIHSVDAGEPYGFHDEFMAKLPEFSLSWRQAALNERKY